MALIRLYFSFKNSSMNVPTRLDLLLSDEQASLVFFESSAVLSLFLSPAVLVDWVFVVRVELSAVLTTSSIWAAGLLSLYGFPTYGEAVSAALPWRNRLSLWDAVR